MRGIRVATAREYRDKHGMEMPTLTLAKIMYAENKLLYKDVEDARSVLRKIEGKSGKGDETKITHPYPERSKNPFQLPIPDNKDLEPYRLPLSWNDFILAADMHIPNHRNDAIEAWMKYAQENKIKKLLINGDLLDNTPFTRWLHEPVELTDVPRWFDMAKDFLVQMKKVFDEVIWLEGNHDFWYKRWLMEKAKLIFKDNYFRLEERLQLNNIGVKFIDQRYLVKAGKLNIHHGHILLRGGGSYANGARMLYQKAKSNMISSHLHVESSHTEPDVDDKIVTTFITGCNCTLRPEYQPFGGKACHGFAHIKVFKGGNFSVKNYRVYKGEIL